MTLWMEGSLLSYSYSMCSSKGWRISFWGSLVFSKAIDFLWRRHQDFCWLFVTICKRNDTKVFGDLLISFLAHKAEESNGKKIERVASAKKEWRRMKYKKRTRCFFQSVQYDIFSTSKNKTNKKIWLYLFITTVIWSRTLFLRSLQF